MPIKFGIGFKMYYLCTIKIREAPRSVWAAGAQRLGTLHGKAREPVRKGSAAWADALGSTQGAAPEVRQK